MATSVTFNGTSYSIPGAKETGWSALSTYLIALANSALPTTLTDGDIFVGNGSNVATGVTMSGDVTISNTGVSAIGASKVTNVMLAGSIEDSKLNTISTAGKVSGSAITSGTIAGTTAWNTSGSIATTSTINSTVASGSVQNTTTGSSLATGQKASWTSSGTGNSLTRSSEIGVFYNNAADTNAPTGIVRLHTADDVSNYLWFDDSDRLHHSTSTAHIGTAANGTILVGQATTDTFTNKTFNVDGTGNSLTNIANANIKAAAAIAGSKIDPDFGAQNIQTTGSITGAALTADGAVTINDSGADVDMRVEGDNRTHLFFLDASIDVIGINTNTPAARLDIYNHDSARLALQAFSEHASFDVCKLKANNAAWTGEILSLDATATGASTFKFLRCRSDSSATERFVVDGAGNVEIDGTVAMTANDAINWTSNGGITGTGSIFLQLDSDNTGAGERFSIYHNSATLGGGTELFRFNDAGNFTVYTAGGAIGWDSGNGGFTFPGSAFLQLDSNNDASGERFSIYHNSSTLAGGTELFRWNDAGDQTMYTSGAAIRWETGNGGLEFPNSCFIQIESGNAGAGERFSIYHNNTTLGSGSELFRVSDNGDVRIVGLTSTDPIATDADGDIVAGTSDRRLKIIGRPFNHGLETMKKIPPYYYQWKKGSKFDDGGKLHAGFIAQDVALYLPFLVGERAQGGLEDCKTFSLDKLVPVMYNAILEIAEKMGL